MYDIDKSNKLLKCHIKTISSKIRHILSNQIISYYHRSPYQRGIVAGYKLEQTSAKDILFHSIQHVCRRIPSDRAS